MPAGWIPVSLVALAPELASMLTIWRPARQIGIGTAATLLGIELRYATVGRISRIYLLDSVVEALWIVLRLRQRRRRI